MQAAPFQAGWPNRKPSHPEGALRQAWSPALPENITDLNDQPLSMQAAVSLALTIAAMGSGPAGSRPKSLLPQKPPPPLSPQVGPAFLKTSNVIASASGSASTEKMAIALQPSSRDAVSSPAKAQPSAASEASSLEGEGAADAALQDQLLAAMMALLQQQQPQQRPTPEGATAAKSEPKPASKGKAPAPPFLEAEQNTAHSTATTQQPTEQPPSRSSSPQPKKFELIGGARRPSGSHGQFRLQPLWSLPNLQRCPLLSLPPTKPKPWTGTRAGSALPQPWSAWLVERRGALRTPHSPQRSPRTFATAQKPHSCVRQTH